MKLFTFPPSPNAIKIAIIIEHLGLDVEREVVNLTKGEQKNPNFLEINPNGKIPALVDANFNLWESNAILQYLGSKTKNTIWPEHSLSQANISRWLFWQSAHWGPTCGIFTFENFVKPKVLQKGEPDKAEIEKGLKQFSLFAAILNDTLQSNKFLSGSEFTIADIAIGAWLTYWNEAEMPLADFPHIEKWYQTLTEFPSWQKAVAESKMEI
jgi:glutathione S-transferase